MRRAATYKAKIETANQLNACQPNDGKHNRPVITVGTQSRPRTVQPTSARNAKVSRINAALR